jgi:hypothetical protein
MLLYLTTGISWRIPLGRYMPWKKGNLPGASILFSMNINMPILPEITHIIMEIDFSTK